MHGSHEEVPFFQCSVQKKEMIFAFCERQQKGDFLPFDTPQVLLLASILFYLTFSGSPLLFNIIVAQELHPTKQELA